MRFDIATLFPDMCRTVADESILGRAQKAGKLEIYCHNIRDYSTDKHHRTDDSPYGGGMGMLMQCQPIFDCLTAISESCGQKPHVIYLSPKGRVFTQQRAKELSLLPCITLLCGHYEGVDQRVLDEMVDEEISLGDFVLTGGELAALSVMDCIARMCEGVLSAEESFTEESHWDSLLEYPHYTRPAVWHGMQVPEVLQSGNHGLIAKWRREQSLLITLKNRPDMLEKASLSKEDRLFLKSITDQNEK